MKKNKTTKPAIISIVGISGSGKTTLLEKLIKELTERGVRLATIKHSCHPHPLDVKGKDSWRHKNAGAKRTLFVGPQMLQLVADVEDDSHLMPEELAGKYFQGMDLVLIEGFQKSGTDKLEVVRGEHSKEAKFEAKDGLVAVITDLSRVELGNISKDTEMLDLDNISEVADFIVKHLKLNQSS